MSEIRMIDVMHLGRPKVICCYEVGGLLVDPGPESCHGTLVDALQDAGVRPEAVLLTHIHLDHAGGTGALLRRWPDLQVWVHERGAPHVIDPSKLAASAERLYGDDMKRLWGEIVPVAEGNVHVLNGEEGAAAEGWSWFYAPGHASHHVVYIHDASGTAFTGDVAGVRIDHGPALPPTPPPDIDIELWQGSLDQLESRRPSSLAVTHFGRFSDVDAQIADMREGLRFWSDLARRSTDDEFQRVRREAVAAVPDAGVRAAYEQADPPETQWPGLHRYWEKRVP